MPYRRPQQSPKKYIPSFNNIKTGNNYSDTDIGYYNDFISIPLPNEKEGSEDFIRDRITFPRLTDIFDFFKVNIKIEELILIGLIILLLGESVVDDLLLILLVYILLF